MKTKHCKCCDSTKPLNKFGKDKRFKDKATFYCKECLSDKSKQTYQKNKEEVLEKAREYYYANHEKAKAQRREYKARPENIIKQRKYAHDSRKRHPVKFRARNLSKRIKTPKTCSFKWGMCEGRLERHHWDYDKPREVVPFCRKHHGLADKIQQLIHET